MTDYGDPEMRKLINLFNTEFAFWKYWDQWVYFCEIGDMKNAERMKKKWQAIE